MQSQPAPVAACACRLCRALLALGESAAARTPADGRAARSDRVHGSERRSRAMLRVVGEARE